MEHQREMKKLKARKKVEEKGYIPEYIVKDILLKLSVKSLVRFKAVHSSWRSLISSTDFVLAHQIRAHSPSKYGIMQVEKTQWSRPCLSLRTMNRVTETPDLELVKLQTPFRKLDFCNNTESHVYGSCNGLLLIAVHLLPQYYIIWNPSTGEYKKIIKPEFSDGDYVSFLAGIGYDAWSNSYKVVCVHNVVNATSISVYNLKQSRWVMKESINFQYKSSMSSKGITVANGTPHWVVRKKSNGDNVIINFDVAEEKFKEIMLPAEVEVRDHKLISISGLEGCLCVGNYVFHTLELWIMKEYGIKSSWSKSIVLGVPDIWLKIPGDYFIALGYADAEKDQIIFSLEGDFTGLYIYYRSRGKFKTVFFGGYQKGSRVASYVESLVSPNF